MDGSQIAYDCGTLGAVRPTIPPPARFADAPRLSIFAGIGRQTAFWSIVDGKPDNTPMEFEYRKEGGKWKSVE